jgi:hypothetical protein
MKKRKPTQDKGTFAPAPASAKGALEPGDLVQYRYDGLRAAYVISVDGDTARIQPIAAYKAALPRAQRFPISDLILVMSMPKKNVRARTRAPKEALNLPHRRGSSALPRAPRARTAPL